LCALHRVARAPRRPTDARRCTGLTKSVPAHTELVATADFADRQSWARGPPVAHPWQFYGGVQPAPSDGREGRARDAARGAGERRGRAARMARAIEGAPCEGCSSTTSSSPSGRPGRAGRAAGRAGSAGGPGRHAASRSTTKSSSDASSTTESMPVLPRSNNKKSCPALFTGTFLCTGFGTGVARIPKKGERPRGKVRWVRGSESGAIQLSNRLEEAALPPLGGFLASLLDQL
jgi:hypothetical protein